MRRFIVGCSLVAVLVLLAVGVSAQDRTYTVRGGDTLAKIAAAYNVSVDDLQAANDLYSVDVIFVGQTLVIPEVSVGTGGLTTGVIVAPNNPAAPVVVAPVSPAPNTGGVAAVPGNVVMRPTYTVQMGDTLFGIALGYGVRMQEIVALNGLASIDYIRAGQVLVLPERATPIIAPGQPVGGPHLQQYVVHPGDYLGEIALMFDTTVTLLVHYNHLENPSLIFPGDVLIVPGH